MMLELIVSLLLAMVSGDRAEADTAFSAGEWARARTLDPQR